MTKTDSEKPISDLELLKDSPLVSIHLDQEGKIKHANPAFSKLVGIRTNQLTGKSINKFLSPSSRFNFSPTAKISFQGEIYFISPGKKQNLPPQQRFAWLTPLHNKQAGFLLQAAALGAPVSEVRVREAQQAAKIGYWAWYPESNLGVWSAGTASFFGYPPDKRESSSNEFYDRILPEDLARARAANNTVLETGEDQVLVFRIKLPDNSIRCAKKTIHPIRDEQGKIIGIHGALIDITELYQREQELAESRELYRTVIEESPVLICAFSTEGTRLFANQRYLNFIKNVKSQDLFQFFQKHLKQRDLPLELGNSRGTFEHKIKGKNGQTYWFRCTYQGIFDQNNNCTMVQAFGEDITEIRKAAQVLSYHQDLLEQAQRLGRIGYWQLEVSTGEVTYSDEIYRILEQDPQEKALTPDIYREMVHPEDRERLQQKLGQARDNKSSYEDIHRIVLADGKIKHIRELGIFQPGENNHNPVVFGTIQDITESIVAQEDLARSEKLLQDAQKIAKIANWELDPESNQFSISDESRQILGVPQDQVLSLDLIREWIKPEDRQRAREAFDRLRQGGDLESLDLQFILPPNQLRHGHLQAATRKDGKGTVTSIFGTIQDVTEQVLIETRLRHSQKMEALGRMAGGVAHDFNNLLQIILGYGEVLADLLPSGAPETTMLKRIQDAGSRARDLVKRMLLFSRKDQVQLVAVSLSQIIGNICGMLTRIIGDDVIISYSPQNSSLLVDADPSQIEQAIINLCLNARDSMSGGGEIRIEIEDITLKENKLIFGGTIPPGKYSRIIVSDSGCGISGDHLPYIFDPFFTTKGLGHGTGLGLSSVYAIMKRHQGYIDVKTDPESGTELLLYFPASKGDNIQPQEQKTLRLGNHQGLKVLIAEDDDSVRSLAAITLQAAGYEVLEAADGKEAVTLFQKNPGIELLVFDVVMPLMNGQEAASAIRKLAPEIPVLFCTGYSEDKVRQDLLIENDCTLIRKPYLRETLLQAVEKALKNHSA